MPVPESYRVDMGHCACCSRAIASDSYRDFGSLADARVNHLCQRCIDRTYFGVDQEEGRVLPIFDGAVVAVRAPGKVAELAFIPFRLVVPETSKARLVWEARFITRAGPWLDLVDLAYELDPMAGLLLGHQVRLHAYRAFDAVQVTERLSELHFLVGLDRRSLDLAAAVCPLPDRITTAGLAEEIHWVDLFDKHLLPIQSWIGPDPKPLSTLRSLALMGMVLMEQGRDRLRPLDYLVESRSEFFREQSDEPA